MLSLPVMRPASRAVLLRRLFFIILCVVASSFSLKVMAQDVPLASPPKKAALSSRTSPFDPPQKDVFVTDVGPSLDTGCTFNTSSANPLTIDIVIDRFVGDVDADGHLLNPAPLIAAGIIPATVDLVMPAYDVDFNGTAPPERDEVRLNGQSLGFLTGDDNIWKLNTFPLDIRLLKFPARPAPGSVPSPAVNQVKIYIDTLSSGRWCTSVDWAAFIIPIRPKIGLELSVTSGHNSIRSALGESVITKIYEQTFDANCNVTNTIDAYDTYPFSGPAVGQTGGKGQVRLKTTIKTCPENSIAPPAVMAEWKINGTGQQGTTSWTGLTGDVVIEMPQNVGAYQTQLKYKFDSGEEVTAQRKLFVTKRAPLAQVAPPILAWYEKATQWASGENNDEQIVSRILSGLYAYGNANWRYGYNFGAKSKCDWQELTNSPMTCNYSDCYVFSDVLENISATLGIGGMTANNVYGTSGNGFLTKVTHSLDPAFPGSARTLGGATYDRYVFSSHSLRLRSGSYYDATFNGQYGSNNQFITANLTGNIDIDVLLGRLYNLTSEGAKIYPVSSPATIYDGWGNYEYWLPAGITSASAPVIKSAVNMMNGPIQFPGSVQYRTVDDDKDSLFEALEVAVDADLLVDGTYTLFGVLKKDGRVVANRPAFESAQFSKTVVSSSGRVTAVIRFSGEQIRQFGENGPYEVQLIAQGEAGVGQTVLTTPAYHYIDFGELPAGVIKLLEEPIDQNFDGLFEGIRISASLEIVTADTYLFQTSLLADGDTVATRTSTVALASGNQSVEIDVPGLPIRRSGKDGPYQIVVTVFDSHGSRVADQVLISRSYTYGQFAGVVNLVNTPSDMGVDTNANGLYEWLRVNLRVQSEFEGNAILSASLVSEQGLSVHIDQPATFVKGGEQDLVLNFPGPAIRNQEMDGPYTIHLTVLDPSAGMQEIDSLAFSTGAYNHNDFDASESTALISLTGSHTDSGIDLNGNGLYDRLSVNLGLNVVNAGLYEWSVRLTDKRGIEIGFVTGKGNLPAGKTSIEFMFDGALIGASGTDGPYSVSSLIVFGPKNANLVVAHVAQTQNYRAEQFEGYVKQLPGDLNGDGVVDESDVELFKLALGSAIGHANYNPAADLDADGRVTLNDLRLLRSMMGKT